ncbi:hypothetical protein ACHMWL_19955, partial [Aeromonas caviae]
TTRSRRSWCCQHRPGERLQGSYGVWSHRGEQFRQRILSLVETAKRLGRCPQEWLRAVVRSCIEKTDYPFPEELVLSTPSR